MKYLILPLSLIFSFSVLADVEDYTTEDCDYNPAYSQFIDLQPGDEISFLTNNETVYAPSGRTVMIGGESRLDGGTPYRSADPENTELDSSLVLRNRSSQLLKMTADRTQTLTVVGPANSSDGSPILVQSANGYSFTLGCVTHGAATDDDFDCNVESLLSRFDNVRVSRNSRQLTRDDIPEMRNCSYEHMVIQEASLQTTEGSRSAL